MDLDELYLLLAICAVAPYVAAAAVDWLQHAVTSPASLPDGLS